MTNFRGQVRRIDLQTPEDARALISLLGEYAQDPMGGGKPLPDDVLKNLPTQLHQLPQYRGLLAWDGDRAVGLLNAFLGFSTFHGRPLLNLHDLAVTADYRGTGVGSALLAAADELARSEGCYAVTLEVRADNPARRLYLRHGFDPGHEATDAMSFWKKRLD
ncbi:MAG: GNAT family N-acetyltransferase [Pirellulaceae bacterium]